MVADVLISTEAERGLEKAIHISLLQRAESY